jgi:AraC-like DNA-binding protein/mannose-6-phosphate isomerase-like protein (cupin superfamily)
MQAIQKAEGFEAQKLIVFPDAFLEDVSRHPLVKPVYVTDIGFFPRAQYHYRERPDGCSTHIFIYCVEGEGWVILENNRKLPIYKNTLVVIPARTPHIYGAAEANPWSIYWFHLEGEAVQQFIQSFNMHKSTLYVPATEGVRIINLFEECYEILLYKGYSFKHYLYVSQAMRYLLGIIALLQGEASQDERKNVYIELSIQYMIEQIHTSLTLGELANHVNLSKPHFIHLFKQITGYSPIDYYLRLKIQRSCQYLDLTDQTIKTVSKNVGIQDPYYFSRVFRKIMGQSPSDYRKTKKR